VNKSIFFSISSALVQSVTYFLRAIRPLTIWSISLCSSGSPPGIETIGAPHSSAALIQNFIRIINLAATGAGEVAAEQRLEHEHERVVFVAFHLLLDDVKGDIELLA
jgi:hypothetical protein